jgi:hypothetical protein
MDSGKSPDVTRRGFLHTSVAGAAALAIGGADGLLAAPSDQEAVVTEIAKHHDATVKALRDWIALPSIAAENLNYPQGAEYMARLAKEAGFVGSAFHTTISSSVLGASGRGVHCSISSLAIKRNAGPSFGAQSLRMTAFTCTLGGSGGGGGGVGVGVGVGAGASARAVNASCVVVPEYWIFCPFIATQ